MAEPGTVPPETETRKPSSVPPCRRCGNRSWSIERRRKSLPRWFMETVFAAPDVWIFQSESGGWPGKEFERWTCQTCGRRVRVSTAP